MQYTFSGREGECDSSMIGPNGIDNLLQWPSHSKANFKEPERQVSSRACHSPLVPELYHPILLYGLFALNNNSSSNGS